MKKVLITLSIVIILSHPIFALNEDELRSIANAEYKKYVPLEYQIEYSKFEVKKGFNPNPTFYPDAFYFTWQRTINGIAVTDDKFIIGIYSNGEIFLADYKFSVPRSQIDTQALLTLDQAKFVVNRNILPIAEDRGLEIQNNKLYYTFIVKGGNYVRVDAKTGFAETYEWALGGGSGGTAQFNLAQYYFEVYSTYILLLLAIVLGGVFYLWKHLSCQRKGEWNISAQGALNTTWDIFGVFNYTASPGLNITTASKKVRILEYPWWNTSFNCRRLVNVTQNTANNGSGIK